MRFSGSGTQTPGAILGLIGLWAVLSLGPGPRAVAADPAKPNVILILADDLGNCDLGCIGQ